MIRDLIKRYKLFTRKLIDGNRELIKLEADEASYIGSTDQSARGKNAEERQAHVQNKFPRLYELRLELKQFRYELDACEFELKALVLKSKKGIR